VQLKNRIDIQLKDKREGWYIRPCNVKEEQLQSSTLYFGTTVLPRGQRPVATKNTNVDQTIVLTFLQFRQT